MNQTREIIDFTSEAEWLRVRASLDHKWYPHRTIGSQRKGCGSK